MSNVCSGCLLRRASRQICSVSFNRIVSSSFQDMCSLHSLKQCMYTFSALLLIVLAEREKRRENDRESLIWGRMVSNISSSGWIERRTNDEVSHKRLFRPSPREKPISVSMSLICFPFFALNFRALDLVQLQAITHDTQP